MKAFPSGNLICCLICWFIVTRPVCYLQSLIGHYPVSDVQELATPSPLSSPRRFPKPGPHSLSRWAELSNAQRFESKYVSHGPEHKRHKTKGVPRGPPPGPVAGPVTLIPGITVGGNQVFLEANDGPGQNFMITGPSELALPQVPHFVVSRTCSVDCGCPRGRVEHVSEYNKQVSLPTSTRVPVENGHLHLGFRRT